MLQENLTLVQVKSIKKKKTFLRNTKTFLVNDIRFEKNEKIVDYTRHALRKFLKIHDGCFTGASL
jgi:hypothetical protein